MLTALLIELAFRTIALLLTVWAAPRLTSRYIEAFTEIAKAYITIVDLLYTHERLPLRV